MPPDAAIQDAAFERIERRQDQEELARTQLDRQQAKNDAIIKAKAAKAGFDGAPRPRDGKESGKLHGDHGRGAMDKGLHKKNEKIKGTKTTKEAAKWTKKLAAQSKQNQEGGDAKDQGGANDAPQQQSGSASGGGGSAGPIATPAPPGGGGGSAPGASTETTTGTASGTGTKSAGTSLTKAPPSKFAGKVGTIGSDVADEGKKEAAAKQEALPDFKANIGAPPLPDANAIEKPQSDTSLEQGGTGSDASAPTLRKTDKRKHKKKKPGADMKSAQSETPPDVLARLFAESLAKVDTTSTVSTNPGPAPTIAFSGGSDPSRAGTETTEADGKIAVANADTAAAIAARPGSDEIQPITIDQKFEPAPIEMPAVPEISADAAMTEYEAKMGQHGDAVADEADKISGPDFDQKLAEAQAQIDASVQTRDTDYAAKVEDATKQVDDLNLKAAADQDKKVDDARASVVSEHASTKVKQDRELDKAKGTSDKAKKDVEKKIDKRRRDDDKKIGKKYKDADRKAKAEKTKAEAKAEAEKKKAAAKGSDASWFSRAASSIGSFIDAVATAVTTIFDRLSGVVASILNTVKTQAMTLIGEAISFATSALDGLGSLLKGLVDSLIGDIFPGLASALNDFIDSTVATAKAGVEAIGEQLKTAVAAAVDGLNAGVQLVINAYKAAVTTALALTSALVSGDWEGALLILLEGALNLAGIDKSQFYGLVGQGTDTLKSIVDDPGSFVGNMIDAVGQGFGQFAGNFGTHLMGGAIDWLTGSLGEAGVTLPETWDAMGVFGLVLDVMGLSTDKMKDKVTEKIGEENMALLETVWGYVQATLDGGLQGLWDHASGQIGDLWAGLLDGALAFLQEKVVTAAITKIASMFSPVGAIVQAVLTAWNVYSFVQEQAQKIASLVSDVMGSMSEIVAGQLGAAASAIESSLANLIPVAISLLANLLGLGGIAARVKEIVESLQTQVDGGVDFAIDKLAALGLAAFDAVSGKTKDEATVPGDAPPSSAAALETVQFPAESTFGDAQGHSHRLWGESANGDGKMMVASTPRDMATQIGIWDGAIAKMKDPAQKTAADALLATVKTLQAQADQLSAAIDGGSGNPAALAAKQTALEIPVASLFSLMWTTGTFAGVDPDHTIGTPKYLEFKGKYEDAVKALGDTPNQAELDEIWLLTVCTIQETQARFDDLVKAGPDTYKVKLSTDAAKSLNDEFNPLLAKMQPMIDKWVTQNSKKKWAFWGGQPGQAVACNAPGYNALESSAIGRPFDGVDINGSWNIQLWGALSKKYAEALAANIEDSLGFAGFLGVDSTGVETIYNQVESLAVAKALGHNRRSDVTKMFTWYATVCAPPQPGKKPSKYVADTAKSLDGIPGAFFKSADRNAAISEAEDANRTVLGWHPKPHYNLLVHLQDNGDAGTSFDANLMSTLENANAPADRGAKLPATEADLFHHRPTLTPLFVQNSSVGSSLTEDLKSVEVTVNHGQFSEKRDFNDDTLPYFEDFKKEVPGSLAGSVRSTSIKDSVLQGANPKLPNAAKAAVETWLEAQPSHRTPAAQIPAAKGFTGGDESHTLRIEDDGLHVRSEDLKWADRAVLWRAQMNNLTKPCADEAERLLVLATPIAELIERMTDSGAATADIDAQKALLAPITAELFNHVPAEPKLYADRELYEQKLGVWAMGHADAKEVGSVLVKKAYTYMRNKVDTWTDNVDKADKELVKLMKMSSTSRALEYTGRVGENLKMLQQIFRGNPKFNSLAEMLGHANNVFENVVIADWASKNLTEFTSLCEAAGADAVSIDEHCNEVLDEYNDGRVATAQKAQADMAAWQERGVEGPNAMGEFDSVTMQTQKGMRDNRPIFDEGGGDHGQLDEFGLWSKKSIADFEALGGVLNPKEKTLKSKRADDKLPYAEGRLKFLLDTTSDEVKKCNQDSIPLTAGVSGTCHRMFKMAEFMGYTDKNSMRFAMVGYLVYLHHSYHEVMVAAGNNGATGYSNKCDYGELTPPGRDLVISGVGDIPGGIPSS